MPANYALYSSKRDHLPREIMRQLADSVTPEIGITERGLTFTYHWPDLKIIVAEMPQDQIADHLQGFEGYVRHGIYHGDTPSRGAEIIGQIRRVKLVVGIEAQPDIDEAGRAEELIGRMCGGLRPMMFCQDAIYDWMGRLLLGPDQSFDPSAELAGIAPA
jgi:hypothetical protein